MSRNSVALGLQGGGSHGAYTWGVLDRLLEEDALHIEAVSGASAGAVNAAVLAHGYCVGGREGAKHALDAFWRAVGSTPYGIAAAPVAQRPDAASRGYLFLTRLFSPYQLNPLNLNPLRDLLAKQIDFERVRAACPIKLFVSATRVSDGALRIFTREELTLDALLASTCIPSIHHTVEVDGTAYWDGGLAANPPLSALVYDCDARDIVLVLLNPAAASDIPSTADAIEERLRQIAFSSPLSTELNAIMLAKAQAERAPVAIGRLERRLRNLELHRIESAAYMAELDPASRFNTDAAFIARLRDEGRSRAERWLRRHSDGIHLARPAASATARA